MGLTEALSRLADRMGLEVKLTIETRGHRFIIEVHTRSAYGMRRRFYRDVGDLDLRDVVDWIERIQG